MALGLTHLLTEMSVFPGGKGGRCVRLTTLPPSCNDCAYTNRFPVAAHGLHVFELNASDTMAVCLLR